MKFLKMLTKKNLKLNRKRTIVTIIGVILSVALITTVADMYMTGVNSLIEYEKSLKGAFHYSIKAVDYKDLEYIESNRQLKDYAYVKSLGFAKLDDDDESESKPYANVVNIAKDDLDVLRFNLKKGKLPSTENEIMIPEDYISDGHKVKIGDTISLDLGKRIDQEGNEIYYNADYSENEEDLEEGVNSEEKKSEESASEKIIDTEKKEYKVTGIFHSLSNYVESYHAAGYTFITIPNSVKVNVTEGDKVDVYLYFKKSSIKDSYDVVAKLLGISGESMELVVKGEIDGKSPDDLAESYKDLEKTKYPMEINAYLIMMEENPLKAGGIDIIQKFAVIISLIVVAASVFCIKNSFDISVTEKTKQYGMLRSVGATKAQLRFSVLYEAYYIGIIGIPLGIALGLVASYILTLITNHLLPKELMESMELVFVISSPAIVFAVILAVITILLSSFGSARRATKISPIESIRNSGNIKIKGKKLKVPYVIRKTCGIGGELSYKNLKRNKKKYRTTVIAMVITIICFIILNSVVGWLYKSVKDEMGNDQYVINGFIDYDSYKKTDIKELTKIDGVNEIVTSINATAEGIDKNLFANQYVDMLKGEADEAGLDFSSYIEDMCEDEIDVNLVDDKTLKNYAKKIGVSYDDVKDGAIYVDGLERSVLNKDTNEYETSKFNKFKFKAGDTVKAKTYILDENADEDSEEAPTKDIEIKICAVAGKEPDYMKSIYSYYPTLVMSEKLFDKLYGDTGYKYDVKYYVDSENDSEINTQIKEFVTDNYSYHTFSNQYEQVKMIKNLLLIISIFLYGFIIVVTLIGVTSIFNTITTSIRLRAQEFAMLKSIGMTKKEFKRMIRLESIFMGVKALFYGLILGLGASYVVYKALGGADEFGGYSLPYSGIGISVVVVIVIISIIMGYAVKKNSNQNIIETIRNENI